MTDESKKDNTPNTSNDIMSQLNKIFKLDSTIQVLNKLKGYSNAKDAQDNSSNTKGDVPSGTYSVFATAANGAVNVTQNKGQPNLWVNPNQNKAEDLSKVNSGTSSQNGTNGGSVKSTDNSKSKKPSSGNNKKVYSPPKDKIPCYIINLTLGGDFKIEFECEPDDISDSSAGASYSSSSVQGRSAPYIGYENNESRSVSFSVTLHDDLCKEGIINTVNRLKSLTYPEYKDGVITPPKVLIHIGNNIKGYFVINSVSVGWKKPYREETYIVADVSIDATEVVDIAYSAKDIWNNGGYI